MNQPRAAARPGPRPPGHGAATGSGGAPARPSADTADERAPLVPRDRADQYASRWNEVKGMFVDEPRQAVQQADALVGELLDDLERLFREQRQDIERGLDNDDTSTEDLRMALRRYRSFFDRLLSRLTRSRRRRPGCLRGAPTACRACRHRSGTVPTLRPVSSPLGIPGLQQPDEIGRGGFGDGLPGRRSRSSAARSPSRSSRTGSTTTRCSARSSGSARPWAGCPGTRTS